MNRRRDNAGWQWKHIGNIAWRFNFEVVEEDGKFYKVKDGIKTLIQPIEEIPSSKNALHDAWRSLWKEYRYSGINKDEFDSDFWD